MTRDDDYDYDYDDEDEDEPPVRTDVGTSSSSSSSHAVLASPPTPTCDDYVEVSGLGGGLPSSSGVDDDDDDDYDVDEEEEAAGKALHDGTTDTPSLDEPYAVDAKECSTDDVRIGGGRSGGEGAANEDWNNGEDDGAMLMTSLISRFDLIEITYEGDDDFPQRTTTSMTSDLEGGGDEEVALGTREGIEMEMDDFSTSIIPTTTTWSGGNNVASMMSSLNLSEINEESTDENGGLARSTSCDVGGGGGYANNARKKVLSKMTDDDDECTLEVVGTTSCNGRTAMVSLSMSEIESEDDNDDDYDDDDDNDDETPAVEGEECGIFGHSSSHRSVAAIAFSGPRGNISDTSIFVCIAEEVPRLASAPQCNEGLAIERVNINEMDECTGKKDVCITEEIPCLGSENIERGVVDEMDDGCMREVGVVSDITTTRSAAKNPFDSAEVWSENDGIVVKASIRNEFLTGESNAGVDIMDDERERHCEIQMDEVYDISTSGETAVEHVAWDINVGFTANMEGLYRDDDTNISGRIVGEFSCSVQRSPSFGSMSSNDASADCSQSSHSEEEDVLAGRNEYLTMNQPIINRPRRATSLSECLAVVQDYLLDSSDTKSEVVEVPSLNDPFARLFTHDRNYDVVEETSPRDQLIFKYPCHAGAADEEVR
jgi:hypothetical protein